jgi:hypothetical protein
MMSGSETFSARFFGSDRSATLPSLLSSRQNAKLAVLLEVWRTFLCYIQKNMLT